MLHQTPPSLIFITLALTSIFAGAARAQGSKAVDVHCILNAKIDSGGGNTISNNIIEGVRIVIRDGRIESVDNNSEPPADARVFDAAGLTVYPGFVDSSVVAAIVPELLKNEGPARDATAEASARMQESHRKGIRPDASAVQLLDIPEDVANARRKAGFTLALFQPSAATLGGRAALADLSGAGRRDVLIKSDILMMAELRAAAGEGYPVSIMGAVATFRQAIYDADWYRKSWKAYREKPLLMKLPPVDPILASLEPVLDQAMPVAFEANTANQIRRALQLSEELQIRPWIVGGTEAWKVANILASKQIPVLLSLDFGIEPKDPAKKNDKKKAESAPAETRPATETRAAESKPASAPAYEWPNPDEVPPELYLERKRKYDERVMNAVELVKAGVPVAFTTRGLANPNDIHGAIVKIVEKGFPRESVLPAMTTIPLALFGVGETAAGITVGCPAHITVMKGALGEKDTKIKTVFIGSKRFDLDDDGDAPASQPPGGRRRPRSDSGVESDESRGNIK